MVKKFRVGLALQPIATALFANSPFTDGKPNGFVSYRSHIWTDTDPDRCGILPFVFEPGMGFERYVDHVLDVPMYFVYRDGHYIDASGQSFRDFLDGRLPALPGEMPTHERLGRPPDHAVPRSPAQALSSRCAAPMAVPGASSVRCRRSGSACSTTRPRSMPPGTSASDWTLEEHQQLRDAVPRTGLATALRGGTVQDLALRTLEIAEAGLAARRVDDWDARDERKYLHALWEIAKSGVSPATEKRRRFEAEWEHSVDPLFSAYAY